MINLNVRKFVEASMLSAAFVAISVVCISIGLGYFGYIDFIVPAFTGIILLKCDFKYTILSCITSLILIIFIVGDLSSGIMMSQSMILGIVITYFIKRDGSIFDDLFYSSIAACIVVISIDINFSVLTGYSFLRESRDYLQVLPPIYEQYKHIILYLSVACIPVGTVIIGYIATLMLSNKFKIEHSCIIKKWKIIKSFKKCGALVSCSRKSIYVGIIGLAIILLINNFVLRDKYTYIAILFNSIKYIILFFIIQDSFGLVNKFMYSIINSRSKFIIYQLISIYFLIICFKTTSIIMVTLNLYLDYKFNLKLKYKSILNNL